MAKTTTAGKVDSAPTKTGNKKNVSKVKTEVVHLAVNGEIYKTFQAEGMNISLKGIANFEKMKLNKEEEITLICNDKPVNTKVLRQHTKALINSLCIKYLPENQVRTENGETIDENTENRKKLEKIVTERYNVPYLQINSLLDLNRADFEKNVTSSTNIGNEFIRQFGDTITLLDYAKK